MEIIPILVKLPNDIVNHIDEFLGIRILRNGIYMCQIPRTDPRYNLLLKIPTKTIHQNCGFRREDGAMYWSINNFIATVKFTPYYTNNLSESSYSSGKPTEYVEGQRPKGAIASLSSRAKP